MYTFDQKIQHALFSLVASTDFDLSRIVIAENEIEGDCLNLYIEDKFNPKEDLSDCILLEIPRLTVEELCKGDTYYIGTDYQRKCIREEILDTILKELIASVTHG